ncbi:hypothetical protein Palpr_2165 [Paludibacter propionicigenes WB4]|uniref:Uncharacterized protein n=1 Tax=Paludibacter propionicigenes (strain DSM 17365 / JCM 13257 / WB4) TaxID=694427 RepID=E4T6F7_PALPW|nr:hypothetical protein Palpr_2165 [Paludibacter propionicigenes WB4]
MLIEHFFMENYCFVLEKPVILHRDFFIVLDLRLTKIGSKALLPFAFYRDMFLNNKGFVHKINIYPKKPLKILILAAFFFRIFPKTIYMKLLYVIKHAFKTFFLEISCIVLKKHIILHRDFFIVLDLRLTKDW